MSQRYQHHLYGVPSPEEISQNEDIAKGVSILAPWAGSQGGVTRSSSSGQCGDQLEEKFSELRLEAPRLPQQRPNVFHPPHSSYAPPIVTASGVSLPVADVVTSQHSVVSPVSCPPPPPIIFSPPFGQTYGVGDQILYSGASSYQASSGASVTGGESFVGAFADKPQKNPDPGYGMLRSPSTMVNSSRSGARSPLPTPGPRYPAYPADPFQIASTIPFLFKSPSGLAPVGSAFLHPPEAFTGYRLSLSRENLAANIAAFEPSSNGAPQPLAQLSCPGSDSSSSLSGSLVGEGDVAYLQGKL